MTHESTATRLSAAEAPDAVAVLCDAFHAYPVMRFVLGAGADYDDRLRALVGFFVAARLLRDEPMLGIRDPAGRLVAAALVTLPGDRPSPEELTLRREALWAKLGAAERKRYETFGEAAGGFPVAEPHHHLNMIGVLGTHRGRGLGRRLIEAVHELARGHGGSAGVSLTTESEPNVALYLHLGYRLLGRARVGDVLDTCAMFRPVDRPPTE
ncbi:MAG: GNAT family N-acetyltransferase [Candidatus Eiseniibacteriota bacterium]